MIGNIKGIIDKVASRKLGVTAVTGGRRGHRGGGDCLAWYDLPDLLQVR